MRDRYQHDGLVLHVFKRASWFVDAINRANRKRNPADLIDCLAAEFLQREANSMTAEAHRLLASADRLRKVLAELQPELIQQEVAA